MAIRRLFVEKKESFCSHALSLKHDIMNTLSIKLDNVRYILRYDIEGLSDKFYKKAKLGVFSEPPVDYVYETTLPTSEDEFVFAVELLPGQYDQRADSAAQCVQLLTKGEKPTIRCAVVYAIKGDLTAGQRERLKNFFINPVEAREASLELPLTLNSEDNAVEAVELVNGFIDFSIEELEEFYKKHEFAMSMADLAFVQSHFKAEFRNPTVTELKVIDTYWSDHCRHTTFLTALKKVSFKTEIPHIQDTYLAYLNLFNSHYQGRIDKYPCLMDIATMGARELKKQGLLDNLDESDEINACCIKVTALVDGQEEEWLVMFKNETHNHPTEIEPFGGAATCLGGAIRDPLSGRVYVYQAMRITGAGDINENVTDTLKGKLPQRVISHTAAKGFSSYGNQIGLATGIVNEVYHKGYIAKRLETGFVVGAAKKENVVRSAPKAGDKVLLIGGETGRDGCGGATGSSKAHTVSSIEKCGAEVQKGNPLTERKIQRLFRNGECTRLIKKCNDFGAGGVCVAIGELADGLDIDLDSVPKKYQGLNATELAISESQERMAVVVDSENVQKMIAFCNEENLDATIVATVTDNNRMRMFFNGNMIVDLKRRFLNSNGARQEAEAVIKDGYPKYLTETNSKYLTDKAYSEAEGRFKEVLKTTLSSYNVASQKGLGEIFDSTIGAGSVLMPFGGKYQLTPAHSMAAKLPILGKETDTATVAAWGFNPDLMSQSPFVGAIYSVLLSVIKVAISGTPLSSIRLTFQEFFKRLKGDPERWGEPVSALLGALYAQLHLGLAAIGGKDSMSGSFEKLDVPPTLISFALGIAKASEVITNVLKDKGQRVYRYSLKRDEFGVPDFKELCQFLNLLNGEIKRGRVSYAAVVEHGGAATQILKSCFGNGLGFNFVNPDRRLMQNLLGDILLVPSDSDDFVGYDLELLGETKQEKEFSFDGSNFASLTYDEALSAFVGTFEEVYPTTASNDNDAYNVDFKAKNVLVCKNKVAKPKVFIPVFPGTNCEYDTLRRFERAGAEAEIFVFKNRSEADINYSVKQMAKIIESCQIIAFPGGFSGGDEPDGSGKFIATTFQNKRLKDAVMDLLNNRDGLAIGICNGFQALIKLGLVPFGKITGQKEGAPTLTFNNISRHVSTISRIRVSSNNSPWMKNVSVGQEYNVAISHGEGKFVASDKDINTLIKNGQIATQYVDFNSNATGVSPYNPNGSYMAIEGIFSEDGRVFGKMGHSERIGKNLMKNIDGEFDMKIFEAGVEYFK